MKFVDEAVIEVKAGDGGKGCVAFRREPFQPRGGPSGGNGGHGGDIVLEADEQLHTLLDFKFQQHHRAKNGVGGSGGDKHGANGDTLVLRVPIGTVVARW